MSWCAGESRKKVDDILKKTKNVKGDRELQRTPMLLRDEASAVETPSTQNQPNLTNFMIDHALADVFTSLKCVFTYFSILISGTVISAISLMKYCICMMLCCRSSRLLHL
jgi:hypothetical protein